MFREMHTPEFWTTSLTSSNFTQILQVNYSVETRKDLEVSTALRDRYASSRFF